MVDVAGAAIAILTRAPSSGGKRRLFASLGRPADPALLEALFLDTLDASAVPGAVRIVAVEPPGACGEVRALVPQDVAVVPQVEGTLGDRMRGAMAAAFGRGARAVALVGSDLPDLDGSRLIEAFDRLDREPGGLVLGPAPDGGYYLIAATAVPEVFGGIEWGTGRVLAQTLEAAARRRLTVHLLAPMADTDTIDDLRRVRAARTAAWVRSSVTEAGK